MPICLVLLSVVVLLSVLIGVNCSVGSPYALWGPELLRRMTWCRLEQDWTRANYHMFFSAMCQQSLCAHHPHVVHPVVKGRLSRGGAYCRNLTFNRAPGHRFTLADASLNQICLSSLCLAPSLLPLPRTAPNSVHCALPAHPRHRRAGRHVWGPSDWRPGDGVWAGAHCRDRECPGARVHGCALGMRRQACSVGA